MLEEMCGLEDALWLGNAHALEETQHHLSLQPLVTHTLCIPCLNSFFRNQDVHMHSMYTKD